MVILTLISKKILMSIAKLTVLLVTVKLFAPMLNISKIPILSIHHHRKLETALIAFFAPALMSRKIFEKSRIN